MTQDEIILMARKVAINGWHPERGEWFEFNHESLERFANLVAEATKAQPQGEWVDLSDDEIEDVARDCIDWGGWISKREFPEKLIAKFKEKNTPPSVEAAIEATKEKAAKMLKSHCKTNHGLMSDEGYRMAIHHCAEAIRSMK